MSREWQDRPPRTFRLAGRCAIILCAPFVRIHAFRLDATQHHQTGVVIANHRSVFDPVGALVGFHRVGRYPRSMSAQKYFEMPVVGSVLRSMRWINAGPGDPGRTTEMASEVLKDGIPVLILPEGRLGGVPGDPLSISSFRTGAARIAHTCGVPVWAFAHVGTDDFWPRDARFPRLSFRRKLIVGVGAEEIRWMSGNPSADTKMLEEWVRELLVEANARREQLLLEHQDSTKSLHRRFVASLIEAFK